jgi:predicted homoserine dehydrogenase-like protein
MSYTVLPIAGVDLSNVANTNTNSAGRAIPTFGPIGAETFGSDGFRYVFAQAGVAIATSSATCIINASTFQVTLGATGTYLSGASMASGDYGWFSKASV